MILKVKRFRVNKHPLAQNEPRRTSANKRNCGLTIIEVLICMVMLAIVVAGLYNGTEACARGSTANAMHVAAYGLLQDKFEQMRGGDFSAISVANYPTQTLQITTMGGMNATSIVSGTFSCTVTNLTAPSRKLVQLQLNWNYRNQALSENLAGAIVDPNATASLMGSLTGYLLLNPSGSAPLQFTLTPFGGGSNIVWSSATNLPTAGANYLASNVKVQVGGSGTQTAIQYNYQPFPMSNAKVWTIDDSTDGFSATISYDSAHACWRLDVEGQTVVLSTQ